MKSYAEFIKESNHIQEKLDATVYGQVRYGATPSKPKSDADISKDVSTAIDNYKTGKKDTRPKFKQKKRKLSFSGYASLSYEKKSGGGKTPPTKVRPEKTTDPKTPKNTKGPKKIKGSKTTTKLGGTKTVKTVKTVKAVKGGGGRPNKPSGNDVRPIKTSTPSSTKVLSKGSNTSSSPSTSILQKTKTKPSTPVRPVRGV